MLIDKILMHTSTEVSCGNMSPTLIFPLGSGGGEGEHQDPQHRHRIRHLRKLGRRPEGK